MEKYEFQVETAWKGRLDQFLVERFPKPVSRSRLKSLFDQGKVWMDGRLAKPHQPVKEDSHIVVEWLPAEVPKIRPEPIPLKIVFEDSSLLVIDKQAGLVVHPAHGHGSGTLVNGLLAHANSLSSLGGPFRPGIVHRLDKDTSGLLVCAKNDEAHRALSLQFEKHTIQRTYLALVRGIVSFDEGRIDEPLGRSRTDRKRIAIRYVDGKKAVTHYRVLKRFKDFTLLELTLETGRTHQIRVHLAHLGHPILGDRTYGLSAHFPRQALHAARLGFEHPATKKFLSFESELPDDIQSLIQKGVLREE